MVFKAEAIVAPDEVGEYLGVHHRYRPECQLANNNQLMAVLWRASPRATRSSPSSRSDGFARPSGRHG